MSLWKVVFVSFQQRRHSLLTDLSVCSCSSGQLHAFVSRLEKQNPAFEMVMRRPPCFTVYRAEEQKGDFKVTRGETAMRQHEITFFLRQSLLRIAD